MNRLAQLQLQLALVISSSVIFLSLIHKERYKSSGIHKRMCIYIHIYAYMFIYFFHKK